MPIAVSAAACAARRSPEAYQALNDGSERRGKKSPWHLPVPEHIDGGPLQKEMFNWYHKPLVELFVAGLIALNFCINISEKQFDPYPEGMQRYPELWQKLADAFNLIFLLEFIINIYGSTIHGVGHFWGSKWNQFDFLVVFIGCLSLFRVPIPYLRLLRNLRVFRIFRLFHRVKSESHPMF